MSIQTDLTRIKNAKAAIKAAIEGKGVTVPDATLLDGMAALIESIEAGGSGSGGEILGHKFACGSFTLTKDTTTTYTILTANELFEAVKDDFPGAVNLDVNVWLKNNSTKTNLFYFLAAICWIDNTESFNTTANAKQYLAAFLPRHALNDSSSAAIHTDSYGYFTARSVSGSIAVDSGNGLTAKFGTSYKGYAGSKYNWLVIPLDHGEVE